MSKVHRWIEVDCPICGMDWDLSDLSFWDKPEPFCCNARIGLNRCNFHIKVGNAILFVEEEDYRRSFEDGE